MTMQKILRRGRCAAALMAVTVALVGCTGLSPGIPALVSPYHGASVKDLFGTSQIAAVQFCSPLGGPIEVDVHFAETNFNTGLGVQAQVTRGSEVVPIFAVSEEQGIPADSTHTSLVPLEPGECTTVRLGSQQYFNDPGLPFTFTVTW